MKKSNLLAAISGCMLTLGIVSTSQAIVVTELIPYETNTWSTGNANATARSLANIAEAETGAWGGIELGHSSAYASSESTLEITGGNLDDLVLVDITYTMETGTWKSANDDNGGSIASANSLVSIADELDEEVSIWEAELDQHTTGAMTSGGGDADNVTETVTLYSGHSYIVALEAFAESWAIGTGWARAEAFVDPVFAINAAQSAGFDLNHITPSGSSVSAVPVPGAVWLFASGLLGMIGMARRKKAA